GFIRKLPHHLVASFRATLEEVLETDLLLHVIDASYNDWEGQVEVVDSVLADIGVHGTPVMHVFNKIDQLSEDQVSALRQRLPGVVQDPVFVSAVTDHGLDALREALTEKLHALRPVTEVRIPVGDGRLLAELHREAEILDQRADGDLLVVTARMDGA